MNTGFRALICVIYIFVVDDLEHIQYIIHWAKKVCFNNNLYWVLQGILILVCKKKISLFEILHCMLRTCQYQMKHIYLYSFLFFIVLQSVYNNLVWVLSSVCGNHHNIISFSVCVKKYSSNFILLLTMSWKLIRFVPYVMLDCVLRMTL